VPALAPVHLDQGFAYLISSVDADETGNKPLLSIGILTGEIPVCDDPTDEVDKQRPPGCKPKELR